jgi:hypothetical protein
MKMENEKKTNANGGMRHGPYKTCLTLTTAIGMMTLPIVVVVGNYRWIVADNEQKHVEALCRLWKMSDAEAGKHQSAWIESIPKETTDHIYDRHKTP